MPYSPPSPSCCITLGYAADNTAGNARETAEWLDTVRGRSLRLVTANYHMPRSLLEFRQALPEVEIIAHPVFPKVFQQRRWWQSRASALLVVSEFTKYLVASLRLEFTGGGS